MYINRNRPLASIWSARDKTNLIGPLAHADQWELGIGPDMRRWLGQFSVSVKGQSVVVEPHRGTCICQFCSSSLVLTNCVSYAELPENRNWSGFSDFFYFFL